MNDAERNLMSIFSDALDRASDEERVAYLDQSCAGSPTLRERVEALLRAHARAGNFLGQPTDDEVEATGVQPADDTAPTPAPASGALIGGRYKLLERIGEGGMGEVWMAEQRLPLQRKVALKIIKAGMDTRQVVARFEAERQALALMDHPNIAKVFDAGATESGRPYFVMELVKGTPITIYCDEHRLTLRERLELFLPVCQAIQHAHQKGIIHRDIKPSNVLIAPYDSRPVPKIIDFGVAKAIGQRLTERTLYTGFGAVVGTLEYMSPEQAELNNQDIDTRSDIYALGVLLYELLTSTTPLGHERLTQAAFTEMLRAIREEEPTKPSTRLSTSEELPTISANRHTEPAKLTRLMRGELDWIVMKCLEKDRTRRYETATGLAADLRRLLHHEPVEAGPPSAWYRLRKCARRNRVPLATTAVVAMALIAGTGVSTWEAIRAVRAEGLAQKRLETEGVARLQAMGERNRADLARQEADRRGTEAREVVEFLINDMIGAASPSRTQGKITTVDKVLAQADQNIGQRFGDRPLIEASIRNALGLAYMQLGLYPKAEEHARRAVELRLAHLGPGHSDTIAAQNALGWALLLNFLKGYSPEKHEEAHILATKVFATARKVLGLDHKETLRSSNVLATALAFRGRIDEARSLREEMLPIYKRVLGLQDPDTLKVMSQLSRDWLDIGNLERAKQLGEVCLDVQRRVWPNHPDTVSTMSRLADIYFSLRQFDRALEMRRRTMDACVRVLGLAHPITQKTIGGYLHYALTEGIPWEQARKDLEQLLEQSRRETESEAKLTFSITATCLALLLRQHGRIGEARALLEQTLTESLRLRTELPSRQLVDEVRALAQFLLSRWPGLAPGVSPGERPHPSFRIEAPFRAVSPVADGRIAPGEYGSSVQARFDDDANPGRLWAWGKSRSKSADDLSVWVHAAHTDRSLFLAFNVSDQFIDTSGEFDDGIQVFINGDLVANDMPPGFLANTTGNREGFHLTADAGGHQRTDFMGFSSFSNADWKVGTSRTRDGYIIEFEIPLALIDTRDGPEYVPATSGSELPVNFGIIDNDASVSALTDYGIFWAEDPALLPWFGGEDVWTVSLRLVPRPDGP
jgi:tetratricopeptide (TPR) repeat protein